MKITLFLLIIFIGLAVCITFENQWFIVPPVLIVIFITEKKAFELFLKWKFVLFMIILSLGIPLFLGEKDASLGGISYSKEYFQMSIVMVQRSIIILLSVRMFTNRISTAEISQGLHRIKMQKFGQVFAISMHALPEIKQITLSTITEFRKAPRSQNIFIKLYNYMVKLIVRILVYAYHYDTQKSDPLN